MAQLDVSKLTGADAAVAIASYPRRFRSAFAWSPDEEVELAELASRIGPDGSSAHDHLVDAVSTLMVLGRAIHQVIHSDEPLLHPAVSDPTHRRWDPPPGMTVEDLLDLLESEMEAISAVLRDLRSRDWDRTGRVADGPTVTALDLAREAVRTASEDLRAATVAMEAARKASAPPKSR